MKASEARRNQVIALSAVAALAVAGVGAWMARDMAASKAQAAADAADVPALPQGRLQLLRTNVGDTRYLAVDEVRRNGEQVEATVLVIGKSATQLEGAAMIRERKRIDCASRRVFDGKTGYFDADGKLINARLAGSNRRGRPVDSDEVEAAVLCDKQAAGKTFADFRAAQRPYQMPPDDYEKVAQAKPQDPHGWAWLCAAGARGRWRDTTASDCDRAISLAPKSAEVRLDRAFLNLAVGQTAAAERDFKAVLELDPNNAGAMFARGLMLAMKGDAAGSRALRAKALAIDPKIPDWITTTYGFRISPEYLKP